MISEDEIKASAIAIQRGTGQTFRQVLALPDGSIFLVHSGKMASYCRGLLRAMGRKHDAITFATPENFERCEGARVPAFDVDHAYWQHVSDARRFQAYDFLRLTAAPFV